jgi:hypothetical protein
MLKTARKPKSTTKKEARKIHTPKPRASASLIENKIKKR